MHIQRLSRFFEVLLDVLLFHHAMIQDQLIQTLMNGGDSFLVIGIKHVDRQTDNLNFHSINFKAKSLWGRV